MAPAGHGAHLLLWGYCLQVPPSLSHPLSQVFSYLGRGWQRPPGLWWAPALPYDLFFKNQPDHLNKRFWPLQRILCPCGWKRWMEGSYLSLLLLAQLSTPHLASSCLKPNRVNTLQLEFAVWWQTRTPSGTSVQGTAVLSVCLLDFSCILNIPYQIGSHIESERKIVILKLSHSKETLANIIAISYSSNSCVLQGKHVRVCQIDLLYVPSAHWALSARISGSTLSEWPPTAAMICLVWLIFFYLFTNNLSENYFLLLPPI